MKWRKWGSPFIMMTGFFLAVLFLTGCGSGSAGGGVEADSGTGDLVVSITDAEADFKKYEVDILSIRLTRKNGAVVEAMPNTTRMDFAQYVEMKEILSSVAVPLGAYKEAVMVLDFTNADIQVEVAGVPTPADVRDAAGNPLTTLEVRVELDTNRPLVVAPGLLAHLSLDFDLDATNTVDTTSIPPVVTVEPVLIAEVNPDFDELKKHRMRGPLLSVDADEETFQIGIRPFRHHIDRNRRHFGHFTVVSSADTVYEVDGQTGVGTEGFTLLAEKPLFTAVIVFGELDIRGRVFKAREVFAGDSVPGGDRDAVRGSVISRTGNSLRVHGAMLIRGEGAILLNGDVTVLVGEGTKVTKQGEHHRDTDLLNHTSISVGQRITVFGVVSGTLPNEITVDATEGRVRMQYTTVTGTVNALRPNEMEVDLQRINGIGVRRFDFTGTGSDPHAYIIATGSMTLSEVSEGDPIRLRGHVAGFGAAPPDFFAKTVTDVAGVNAFMVVHWNPATMSPFLSSSSSALELDLSGSPRLHHVYRARVATELTPEPAPKVLPKTNGRGRYAIRQARTTTIHSDFGNFVRDLNHRLDGDSALARLFAHGRYTGVSQTMAARRVTVGLR